jgi:methionyl-tRNA formyltransferase
MKSDLNIIYMGTPEFAVAPLDCLVKNNYHISAVVTSPDKPSGRGLKPNESAVKKYAIEQNIPILQPVNLKSPDFIDQLKSLNPDLIIVVAFRMLPEMIWEIPPSGTINLHASLLPQYRGAAPINWAIINGETKTGVTTFFINEDIDTGKIILSEEVDILPDETAGELHDKLMTVGSDLVLKTVRAIDTKNFQLTPQDKIDISNLKKAPKIFKETCRINWNNNANKIYDHIRGLSPYPAAFTELLSPQGTLHYIKIFQCKKEFATHELKPGNIATDGKTFVSIAVTDGFIHLQEVQLSSKRKMPVSEFLRGFPMDSNWMVNIA